MNPGARTRVAQANRLRRSDGDTVKRPTERHLAHFLNLAKFTTVASAIAFAFAFNLAAMYAQIVYVFLPGTRAQGGAPAEWKWEQGHGFLFDLVSNRPLFLGLMVAVVVVCAVVVRRSPK